MLKTRVLTAAVLLAVLLSAPYRLPPHGCISFCALLLGIAAWDWGALAALAVLGRLIYSAAVVGLFLLPGILGAARASSPYVPAGVYYAAALFWILLVPLWMWRRPQIDNQALLLAAGAVALVPAFAAAVDLAAAHPSLLVAVL